MPLWGCDMEVEFAGFDCLGFLLRMDDEGPAIVRVYYECPLDEAAPATTTGAEHGFVPHAVLDCSQMRR